MDDLTTQIKEILMRHWDPIGVKGSAEAQDEYDLYIPELESFIFKRASSDEIAEYLTRVEIERMGFSEPHHEKISFQTRWVSLDL